LNFTFNHFEGLWKVKRNISPNTCANGLAHIIKNKNSELVFKEKFLTSLDKKNIIFGENQYLIEIKNKELHFIFKSGPRLGTIFQKFRMNTISNSSLYFCLKDTYQTTLYWINQNYFRITHKIKGKNKNLFISSHYYKTNNISLFNKFI
jgi:hypothetical protein